MTEQTRQTPTDIIGPVWTEDFMSHYKKTYRCETKEDFDRAAKSFSSKTRSEIGRIYEDLQRLGYYPAGLDQHGQIKWQCREYDRYQHIPCSDRYKNMIKSTKILNILARQLF